MSRRAGFTLVELLVAVALFALAATLALGGMTAITRARSQLDADLARLAALQFAVGLVERDLRGVAERPVREGYGATRPAIDGRTDMIEISRYGAVGALAQARPDIERIAYQVDGGRLLRLRHAVLDRTPASVPAVDELLDRVVRIEWRYLGGAGQLPATQWPGPRVQAAGLPRAIELRLFLEDYGEIRRVFELPRGAAP